MRHGRAEAGRAGSDLKRELTDPGKRDVQRVGVLLQARGWLPDAVVASPATRAHVTAEKTLKAGGRGTAGLTIDARIYDASSRDLAEVLAGFAHEPARVLLVGHNPGVSDLLHTLSGRRTPLAAGMLAHVAMPADWTSLPSACAELLDVIDPGTLPEGFPFPAPGSGELRSRPAYYYMQSGVMPFRRTEAGIEILIIGSSKRKRWVVPKGIITPGLTAQESAAKEALEEAGIEGQVLDSSLGEFGYTKWGAQVSCEVFPMEVATVHPEDQWEERHRGRKWVSPQVAIEKLGRDELKEMVGTLLSRLG